MNAQSFQVYLLKFKAPVHFSDAMDDYGQSLHIYHSDSMYAALTAAMAAVGAQLPGSGANPYTISSLFPYATATDGSIVYFFPKPLIYAKMPRNRIGEHKVLKKISWLDQHYFSEILRGKSLYEIADPAHIRENAYLAAKQLKDGISKRWVAARVRVPRYTPDGSSDEQSRPFFMERIQFYESSGLYFLALGDTEALHLLEQQLNILQDLGIGTDRNVGHGHFEWTKETLTLVLPESDCQLCCGMFIPEAEHVASKRLKESLIAFRLQRRGGWITTPPFTTYRKNDIYAFDVGTIIRRSNTNEACTYGRLVDLSPKAGFIQEQLPHPIYRNGKTIFLPVKIA